MASQDPKTFLWSNIALLMGTGPPTVDAVQRKTQVGRGTVQRIKEGSTSTGTDTLLAIADAFGVEPWELLHPQLGKQTATLVANNPHPHPTAHRGGFFMRIPISRIYISSHDMRNKSQMCLLNRTHL